MELEKITSKSDEYQYVGRNEYYYVGRDKDNNDYLMSNEEGLDEWHLQELIYNDNDLYSQVVIHGFSKSGKYHTLKVKVDNCLRMITLNSNGTVQEDIIMDLSIEDDRIGHYNSVEDKNNVPHPELAGYLGSEKKFTNMYGEEFKGFAASDKYFLFFLQKNAELIPEVISMENEEMARKKK